LRRFRFISTSSIAAGARRKARPAAARATPPADRRDVQAGGRVTGASGAPPRPPPERRCARSTRRAAWKPPRDREVSICRTLHQHLSSSHPGQSAMNTAKLCEKRVVKKCPRGQPTAGRCRRSFPIQQPGSADACRRHTARGAPR
jgi:hypothetical protein